MLQQVFRSIVAVSTLGVGAIAFHAPSAQAQSAAGPAALVSCLQEPAKLSAASITSFLTSPSSLFQDILPDQNVGSLVVASRVRSLAASSSATVDPLLSLVNSANPDQLAAIGAGLSRAALACVSVSPEYAALIQEKVASMNNIALANAFASSANDIQTAAIGGAAAGAGPSASAIGVGGEAGGGTEGIDGDEGFRNPDEPDYTFASRRYFGDDGGGQSVDASVSESTTTP